VNLMMRLDDPDEGQTVVKNEAPRHVRSRNNNVHKKKERSRIADNRHYSSSLILISRKLKN
jgi:hypothetical protein